MESGQKPPRRPAPRGLSIVETAETADGRRQRGRQRQTTTAHRPGTWVDNVATLAWYFTNDTRYSVLCARLPDDHGSQPALCGRERRYRLEGFLLLPRQRDVRLPRIGHILSKVGSWAFPEGCSRLPAPYVDDARASIIYFFFFLLKSRRNIQTLHPYAASILPLHLGHGRSCRGAPSE